MAKKAEAENGEVEFASIDAVSCPHYFGYLKERPKGEAIPEECLACQKVVECMLSELKSHQPEVEEAQTAEEELKEGLERITEENAEKTVEEKTAEVEIAQEKMEEKIEHEAEVQPKIETRLQEDQFVVKDMGMLYATWTSTVRIPREILSRWGGKVKEVLIETESGNLEVCRVAPIDGVKERVIEIPDKVQQSLGIKQGDFVKVRPCV